MGSKPILRPIPRPIVGPLAPLAPGRRPAGGEKIPAANQIFLLTGGYDSFTIDRNRVVSCQLPVISCRLEVGEARGADRGSREAGRRVDE